MTLSKKLPDSELEVMLVVWQNPQPIHTGQIHQLLCQTKQRKLQPVQTLLGRLVDKSFLRCEKIGRLNFYTPLVQEQHYRTQETASFIDRFYRNNPVQLMAALVEDYSVSQQDLEYIRQLLEIKGEDK